MNYTPRLGRPARTDVAMIRSGQWARIGRKQYQHESGAIVRYVHNDWVWEVLGGPADGERYGDLWVIREVVEKAAAS